ncbi:glycosyltransferase [Anaerobacillus alkaliphilus]|uniref:Glycosyltransferase n=1 Tax=Anaerobacillus alkaliphilus TaxID=1548597 RepID=A0A4Q0VNB3_9BACI|nr:glycosyltransferase family 2 protein [Anaerobacillus alkaliphilus]RXI96466.1 glycosyltransferase [Anaerobacillus alkaliphilus]
MASDLSQKVTAIIKTFERKDCLDNLIRSIKKYYPDLPIIVVDDSKNPVPRDDVEYHILPFDSGVSKGRNFLVNQVKTPYVLILDDDYEFIHETKIEKFVDVLENSTIDLVGGRWVMYDKNREKYRIHSYHGKLIIEDNVMYHTKNSNGKEYGYKLYDIIHQFYLARTETMKNHPWDEGQKVNDHIDFFLNYKDTLKIALHPEVFIYHNKYRDELYSKFRNRQSIYRPKYYQKHGFAERKRVKSHWQSPRKVMHFLSKETINRFRLKE